MKYFLIIALLMTLSNARTVECIKVDKYLTICTDEDGVTTEIWTY